jgi:hypothetical protein
MGVAQPATRQMLAQTPLLLVACTRARRAAQRNGDGEIVLQISNDDARL